MTTRVAMTMSLFILASCIGCMSEPPVPDVAVGTLGVCEAVSPGELSQQELDACVSTLAGDGEPEECSYEWRQVCNIVQWSHYGFDLDDIDQIDAVQLHEGILGHNLIVASAMGREYLLVYSHGEEAAGPEGVPAGATECMSVDVAEATFAHARDDMLVPRILLTPRSAIQMSAYTEDRLGQWIALLVDDCIVGMAVFHRSVPPSFFRERYGPLQFHIPGSFEEDDVRELVQYYR